MSQQMVLDSQLAKLRNENNEEHYLINRLSKDMKTLKRLVHVHDRICKIEYKGLENLIDEPCIFVANHSSHLDIISVYKAILLQFGYDKVYKMCCLAAKELIEKKGNVLCARGNSC